MGHVRLGELPKSRKWRRVVELLAGGSEAREVAAAVAEAAEKDLAGATGDPALAYSVWLLTQIPLAARKDTFSHELIALGFTPGSDQSVLDIVAGFPAAVENQIRGLPGRTDLGELARQAAAETISTLVGSQLPSLFGSNPEDLRIELSKFATKARFAFLARDFFERLTFKTLDYYVSRVLANHVGPNRALPSLERRTDFEVALRLHCREASLIVEQFASGWFSKAQFERRLSGQSAQRSQITLSRRCATSYARGGKTMPEHVFLCGLTEKQQGEFPEGRTLSFVKGAGNVNLKLDRLRQRLVGSETERITDFIEIAGYIFAADRSVSRGPLTDPGFGAKWRRSFHLIIAVRNLEFWQRTEVKSALSAALGFLSEDTWNFQFVENLEPIPLPGYLGFKKADALTAGGTSVLLFSGGLDSLSGAVHELRTTNRHVVLVSHRNLPTMGVRQQQLANALADAFERRVTHVWIDYSLSTKLDREEETQRTRTFFFTAMAVVAAQIESSDRIRFYENGVMSVNLPFSTQLVGARSSRSTHPRSLQLLARLVQLVCDREVEIDNPFIWRTKGEIVKELASTPQAELIKGSVSCSRSQYAIRKFQPHCGTCVQCLQRRISTLVAGAGALDELEGYEIDFLTGPREDVEDRVMAIETIELALDCATVSDLDFLGRFSGPLSWVLQAFPAAERETIARKVVALYRRYGSAVRNLLIDEAKPHVAGVLDRTLSPDSLLALILAGKLADLSRSAVVSKPTRLSEPAADVPSQSIEGLVIAIDDTNRRMLIRDLPPLEGSTIFPIMKFLIAASLEDRSAPGSSDGYRAFRARELANELQLSAEGNVAAAVCRVRSHLGEAADALGLSRFDENCLIERTPRGYRLNPKVQIVTPDEIRGP